MLSGRDSHGPGLGRVSQTQPENFTFGYLISTHIQLLIGFFIHEYPYSTPTWFLRVFFFLIIDGILN